MTVDEMRTLVARVSYRDWLFSVHAREFIYLQVQFRDAEHAWQGRKWILSEHMTASEVVQTAFKAVITAEEHEAREHFLYDRRPVFGPHIDVEALWDVCTALDVRA